MTEYEGLQKLLREFSKEREWDQFHSPKNLAIALSVEASELLEIFQWLTEAESLDLSTEKRQCVGEEMADVFLYLLRLADRMGIDLTNEAEKKIEKNRGKYPADRVRGSSKKYTEYRSKTSGK